jgi:Sec-independent protein translocase protein TatA
MGDMAKGVKAFKEGMREDEEPRVPPPQQQPQATIQSEVKSAEQHDAAAKH